MHTWGDGVAFRGFNRSYNCKSQSLNLFSFSKSRASTPPLSQQLRILCQSSRTMPDHVPFELQVEILARLPVVSLLRFKSVCKSWYSLITSPSFITKHLNHNKNKHILRISTTDDHERYLSYQDDEQCGHECSELEFTYRDVVGSCNGLLCERGFYKEKAAIIVWNPSIRKSVTLPEPQVACFSVLGFGAHPTTHEYKVVRIFYQKDPYKREFQPLVELYTQGATSWRGLGSSFPPDCLIVHGSSQAFVKGAVNWIAQHPSVWVGYRPLVVSFNMNTETFSVMMLPPPLADQKLASLSPHLFRQSLAVSCGQQRGNMAYCIWVMKEYGVPGSWTKIISFEVNHPLLLDRALGVGENGKVLLWTICGPLRSKRARLLSYDTVTQSVTDTKIKGHSLSVKPFIETLVSVENHGGVLDRQLNPSSYRASNFQG